LPIEYLVVAADFPAALMVFFWWAMRERRRLMTQFIEARLLPGLISGVSLTRRKVRMTCLIAAVALAILTLARPQWGFTWEEANRRVWTSWSQLNSKKHAGEDMRQIACSAQN